MIYPESLEELNTLRALIQRENTKNDPNFDVFIGYERLANSTEFVSIDNSMQLSRIAHIGLDTKNNVNGKYCQISANGKLEAVASRMNRFICTFNSARFLSRNLILVSIML